MVAKWIHLTSFAKDILVRQRRRDAQWWKSQRLHAQNSAQMRCARVHRNNTHGVVLLRLVLREWSYASLLSLTLTCKLFCSRMIGLVVNAEGTQICHRILGRQYLLNFMGKSIIAIDKTKLVWKRAVWDQWCIVLVASRESSRKQQMVQHRHVKMMTSIVMQNWERFHIKKCKSTQQQRLLFSR